jgi:hypothetical protein
MVAVALLAGILATQHEGGWKFVDEATRDGRSVITFRTAELSDAPARPLHKDDTPPGGAKYSTILLGAGGNQRLGLVWHAASASVWFDSNGDARYHAAERHILGAKPLELKVMIAFGNMKAEYRTLLIRKRGEGLAYAVRGYTVGHVLLSGKRIPAILTDGNADGCFDGAGVDHVWLDLDGDGEFSPLTEQFPLGTTISHAGKAYLVQPHADGLGLAVRERPAEVGTLVIQVARLPGVEVVELGAQCVSEWGELVVVKSAETAMPIPAGKYRIDSVQVKLADASGKAWHYAFFRTGDRTTFDVEIAKGRKTVHKVLEGIKVSLSMDAKALVDPGESIEVQPNVTAGNLCLCKCEVSERNADYGREVQAELKLTQPGSEVIDRASSGFN